MRAFDRRAAREREAVDRAGHVDVGEEDANVRTALQERQALVPGSGLDDLEPGILQEVDGEHPDERFVLDDEDDGCFASLEIAAHPLTPRRAPRRESGQRDIKVSHSP